MTHYSPKQIAERFLKSMRELDADAWQDFAHQDLVMTFPFSPSESNRFEGRAAVIDFVRSAFSQFGKFSWIEADIYLTDNPDIMFVNAKADCELRNGNHYGNEYVIRFALRDGLLVDYREYANPAPIVAAFG